ncbi:hypothetical protein RJT34_23170 [Clitoria ternatea]|uniref:Uncharacterized protein n=1 Tax=Clitoria ternatea TaxID=43366 RepID=A0AAN9FKM4_CLITE
MTSDMACLTHTPNSLASDVNTETLLSCCLSSFGMENKKREVGTGNNEVEDEMKMEKFYSLLRGFRDARDRRRRELIELEKNESNKKKKMKGVTTMKGNAEVSFEWQDFTTEIQFRKPPSVFPNPVPCDTNKDNNKGKKKEAQHQQHKDLALDLKLAL